MRNDDVKYIYFTNVYLKKAIHIANKQILNIMRSNWFKYTFCANLYIFIPNAR